MIARKLFLSLLSVGAVAFAALGLSACAKADKTQTGALSERTAYAQAAEYGFNGTEQEFAAKVSAAVGGESGVYIKKVELTDDGELIITYTDGTVQSLGYVSCVHSYSGWEMTLEPTCSSIGYNSRSCSKCGDIDYEFLQSSGHKANSFTQTDQSSHTYYCADCGAYVHELHDLQDGECTVCDYVLDYTLGLRYEFTEETQSYTVTGVDLSSPAGFAIEIIIPSTYNDYPVAKIGRGSPTFYQPKSLERVIIPESVKIIERKAFYNSPIKEVSIPDSVETIGSTAFSVCKNLQNIRLPAKLKRIEKQTFFSSKQLTSVILPEGLEEIGSDAFRGCESLEDISLPSSLKKVESSAFCGCKRLNSITIPEGVTVLENSSFSGCNSLSSVTLHDKLTEIDSGAFYGCALTHIDIPSSVKFIGYYAFKGTALESIELPEGLTVVETQLFSDCTALKEVTLPETVVKINVQAFQNCSSLTHIELPSSLKIIETNAFYGSGLTEITLGENVAQIGNYVFVNCKSLTNVILSEGIQKIGMGAFKGCSALKTIALPESLTSISEEAFVNCEALTTIVYEGTKAQWKAVSKASGWRAEDNIITNLYVECSDGTLEYIW